MAEKATQKTTTLYLSNGKTITLRHDRAYVFGGLKGQVPCVEFNRDDTGQPVLVNREHVIYAEETTEKRGITVA